VRSLSFVVIAGLSCLGGSMPAADSMPFALGRQGGILIPASLNGAGPFVMLLDTGASHSSVSQELALTLRLPAVARTTVQSPVGDRERVVVQIDRMQVGAHRLSVRPTVVSRRDLAIAGEVHGVIGQDVLANLRYTIDFRNQRVAWHGGDEPAAAGSLAVLPMAFSDGLPFVDLSQGRTRLRLVPDSGAGGLVLFAGAGRELPASRPGDGIVRLDTLQGRGYARHVVISRLRVGGSTLRDLPAVIVEHGGAGDGLLPLHLFDRVTFDGPAGRLILG